MIPAGFQKNSFIDYPGKISCVIFFSGCNFKCPYCHNPELVMPGLAPKEAHSGAPSLDDIFDFLKKRKGFTDGVVITGGEPTLHDGIIRLMGDVKQLGFSVKLDTNGSRPSMLEEIISLSIVDYVAMDIKTDPFSYSPSFIERYAPETTLKSIDIIMSSAVGYEFRTTCVKPFVDPDIMENICEHIDGAKRYCLQKFSPTKVLDPGFFEAGGSPCGEGDMEVLRDIAAKHVQECTIR
jgi:pyruvate formate lyase activating enzyme